MARIREVAGAIASSPPRALARALARTPLEFQASRLLDTLPTAELVDIAGTGAFQASLEARSDRHPWSLGAAEQLALQAIIAGRSVMTVFEVGTFNGGTTRVLAEALPGDGRVVTVDLPAPEFDATQRPTEFTGRNVGVAYADSPAADKVTQLLVDSLTFDASPYERQFDLVLVDGGHEYAHGVADTKTALRVVAPGGVVLWDDFTPYWHGLVRGICQVMNDRPLRRLAGTSLGVFVAPS